MILGNSIYCCGQAGNPSTMDNVTIIVGVNTEVIAAEGKIITAAGLDVHVHFICPQLCEEALASGLTTMVGGGTGPATGSNATTCTPATSQVRTARCCLHVAYIRKWSLFESSMDGSEGLLGCGH